MMMTSYTTGLLILTTGLFVSATVASKETEQRKDKGECSKLLTLE